MRVLLVVYDNDSYIPWFPQGIAYIAAILEKNDIDVEIFHQDIHHYPDEYLTTFLDNNRFDAVGVSVIAGYYQYRKLLSLSAAINNSRQRPFFIIGGHGPSPEPDFFLRKTGADAVVIGEGEKTVIELLDAVASKKNLVSVEGIAFRTGGKTVVNKRRKLIEDIDKIPFPAYHMFPMNVYRLLRMPHCTNRDFVIPMLSGRGCTFRCNFCYRLDEGFRPRSVDAVVEEIKLLKKDYGITFIAFSDELLMSSVKRTTELCEAFLKHKLDIKWDCNGRLNYAKPEVLNLMRKAGCVFINYGIEAFDDEILKNMNKALTTKQIVKGIEATLMAGISPGFNIIFGNIGENKETLQKGVDFLLKYDDGAQMRTIRPVTGYPGTDLYYYAIKEGLLKDVEEFYEKKHVNSDLLAVNYTELSDDEFHEALMHANEKLLTNYFDKKLKAILKTTRNLYLNKDATFRGYRHG